MRRKPTLPHNIRARGEFPALTAFDLYLAARAELAAYFEWQRRPFDPDEDVTAECAVPTDAELLEELSRRAEGN